MKTTIQILISIMTAVSVLTTSLLSAACGEKPSSTISQQLIKDEEWVQTLDRYLSLDYAEQNDRAAFSSINSRALLPSMYSTYNIVRMLKSIGANIKDADQIVSYVRSLKNDEGVYLDPSVSISLHDSAFETLESISVLIELGFQPEDINSTVNYLLSLQSNDGTFLTNPQNGVTFSENTRLERICKGTASVVKSLIMLGFGDKIPRETKEAVVEELTLRLGDNEPFSNITLNDTGSITCAIELLGMMDPALITERSREFIIYTLNGLVDTPADPYIFPASVNRVFDIAELLALPEVKDESFLEGIRTYLKEKIFSLENQIGGFGGSNVIDPLETSENVVLAKRLGVAYPRFDKLTAEIDRYWVGNGWTVFFDLGINSSSYLFTYYAIEIAKYSGYEDYNLEKVEKFLEGSFSDSVADGMNPASIRDVYYAVMGLKALNGKLSQEDNQSVKEMSSKLFINFSILTQDNYTSEFIYALPLSREAGFELPAEVKVDLHRLAGYMKADLLSGKTRILASSLVDLWESTGEDDNSIFSRDEVVGYLGTLYDEQTGAYNSPIIANQPAAPTPMPTTTESTRLGEPIYTLHPEIVQTYSAMKLLLDIGKNLPDKNKTLDFVVACKKTFGFSRAPEWSDINILSTFAGVMLLKQLEK